MPADIEHYPNCDLDGCDHTDRLKFPMPGEFWAAPGTDQVPNRIVIASVWLPWVDKDYNEMPKGIGTLLLNPEEPHYTVQLWYPVPEGMRAQFVSLTEESFENIVPAAASYQEYTDAWGGA